MKERDGRMLSRIFGARLEFDKDYNLETLKEIEQLAKSVPTIWISVAIGLVGLVVFAIVMAMFKKNEFLYITSIVYGISAIFILSYNTLYSIVNPIEVKNINTLIEAVEVGEYKGVHFLRDAEIAKDSQEDILYLTIESMLKENYHNVIDIQNEDENVNMIAVKQQVNMFEVGEIYQAVLIKEGFADEHMLLIPLDDGKKTIKLQDYTLLEKEKYYQVKQTEGPFVLLKEESLN